MIAQEDFAAADRAYYEDPARERMDPDPASLLYSVETRLLRPVAR
jgi:hypothetical protein